MNFKQAFETLELGMGVVVSDNTPMPKVDSPAVVKGRWKTRNFTGTLAEKDLLGAYMAFLSEPDKEGNQGVYVLYAYEKDVVFTPLQPSAAIAEVVALETVESAAEEITEKTVSRLRRQIAIDRAWNEVQRLKLANATNSIPTELEQRRRQFPTIMAISHITGVAPLTVATQIEKRLWDSVRKNALWEAKLLVAEDQIRSATTPKEKIAIANSIDWSEDS